ncbi:hypothetical protein PHLGIDRAFT_118430 [Phlebiopsis gigantea 11061_1 CR5-6]|uniref:Uncharacterized protein n=1 Tax=Phlebiopsis gigantea (strain 11061_1 CR5-6) TaxID=745531 RepID=A0A0C3NPN0_PHLG1|nr:hypothetical protein PHLGIDRAFT_118430 [Phlebiopsis gigantea 11061_1 CR5-6]
MPTAAPSAAPLDSAFRTAAGIADVHTASRNADAAIRARHIARRRRPASFWGRRARGGFPAEDDSFSCSRRVAHRFLAEGALPSTAPVPLPLPRARLPRSASRPRRTSHVARTPPRSPPAITPLPSPFDMAPYHAGALPSPRARPCIYHARRASPPVVDVDDRPMDGISTSARCASGVPPAPALAVPGRRRDRRAGDATRRDKFVSPPPGPQAGRTRVGHTETYAGAGPELLLFEDALLSHNIGAQTRRECGPFPAPTSTAGVVMAIRASLPPAFDLMTNASVGPHRAGFGPPARSVGAGRHGERSRSELGPAPLPVQDAAGRRARPRVSTRRRSPHRPRTARRRVKRAALRADPQRQAVDVMCTTRQTSLQRRGIIMPSSPRLRAF